MATQGRQIDQPHSGQIGENRQHTGCGSTGLDGKSMAELPQPSCFQAMAKLLSLATHHQVAVQESLVGRARNHTRKQKPAKVKGGHGKSHATDQRVMTQYSLVAASAGKGASFAP